jgi:spore maturation protein CgeB
MTHPRVAVIGKSNHLHWDRHVANAFGRLGCEVRHHPYNRYPLDILARRVLAQACMGKRLMRQRAAAWSARRWAREMASFRPDLVFMTNAFFVPIEYYQMARQLSPTPKVFAWDGDGDACEITRPYYRHLDVFFESGSDYQRKNPKDATGVQTLSFAADETVYENRRQPRENKLYFCGNWTPERDTVLSSLSDFPLVLKGWGWSRLSKKGKRVEISEGTVSVPDLVADYNRYRFVVNTHQAGPFMGMNMRTFEAPACGACQLCDKRDGLDALFTDGREILVYEDTQSLRARAQWAFDHLDEAEQIAERGYRRVLDQHTYLHRMRQVLATAGWRI